MRARTPEEEPLEPLPVFVDGIERPPVPTTSEAGVDYTLDARDIASAVRATIAEAPALLGTKAWERLWGR